MIETRFKKTEIGEIPEDWSLIIANDYIKEISMGPFGSDIKVEYFTSNGIPVLNGYNVSTYRVIDVFKNYLPLDKALAFKKAVAHKGDIIITHRGTLGQVSYIPWDSRYDSYIISQSQFRIKFKDNIIPEFITRYLLSLQGQNSLLEFKGHTGVPALAQPTTNFRNIRLLMPPLPEQQRIATALSDIDTLLSTLTKKIEKKKLIKQGAMQQLLTGKKRLAGFTGPWEEKRLEEVCCNSAYGVAAEAIPYNGIDKYIRITDISDENGRFIPSPLTSPSFYDNNYVVQENDLLIARTGASVGKTYLYVKQDGRLIFAGFLMRINITNAHSKYVFYQTQTKSYKKWINSESMRSGQPGLNMQQLLSYIVAFPPSLEEQSAIATILSDMDKEIEALEAKRTKYTQVKQGMMQQLLTGKIRLVD